MLSANCPCCGEKINFRYEDVLIKCPACNIRFSYDEIMNKQPQHQDEQENEKEIRNAKLDKWKKSSRTLLTIIALSHFSSWLILFITNGSNSPMLKSLYYAHGGTILLTWILVLFGIPLVSSHYPTDEDIDMSKNQKAVTTGEVCIKLGAVAIALCVLTFLCAVIVDEFIEMFS